MLNPKTAAKQFLRKQENRTKINQRPIFNHDDPSMIFDKWGTGGKIIRSMPKQHARIEAYLKKITRTKTVGSENKVVTYFVDNAINTNKFTMA